jgi:Mce-associated membrane protein
VAGLRRPEAPARQDPSTGRDTDTEVTQVIPRVPADVEPDQVEEARPAARPRPTRRPRPERESVRTDETAEMATIDTDDDAVEPGATADAGAEPVGRRSGLRVPLVLAVVAVLIGGLAAWFGVEWAHVRNSSSNTALTDSATTSEVSGQVTSAVNTIFSYDYTNMQKTRNAVQRLLTGPALCQYNQLYKVVQQQAPAQKLVLTTTVQAKGVELLRGNTARVLVLVQQHDTRASTNQTSDAQAVFAVNAVRQGDTWQISGIDTLNGKNPTAGCGS